MHSLPLKIFFSLIILNLLLLNYQLFKPTNSPVQISAPSPQPTPDLSTIQKIQTKLVKLEEKLNNISSPSPIQIPPNTPAAISKKTKHISYLPITGNFSLLSYTWANVPTSQFYFDTADYPGLKGIVFEANLKLLNGNGLAKAQLYDITHSVALPGSQVQTASQQDQIIASSPVTFLSGKNLIQVQIQSLTADTTVFNSGRLIITSEY